MKNELKKGLENVFAAQIILTKPGSVAHTGLHITMRRFRNGTMIGKCLEFGLQTRSDESDDERAVTEIVDSLHEMAAAHVAMHAALNTMHRLYEGMEPNIEEWRIFFRVIDMHYDINAKADPDKETEQETTDRIKRNWLARVGNTAYLSQRLPPYNNCSRPRRKRTMWYAHREGSIWQCWPARDMLLGDPNDSDGPFRTVRKFGSRIRVLERWEPSEMRVYVCLRRRDASWIIPFRRARMSGCTCYAVDQDGFHRSFKEAREAGNALRKKGYDCTIFRYEMPGFHWYGTNGTGTDWIKIRPCRKRRRGVQRAFGRVDL